MTSNECDAAPRIFVADDDAAFRGVLVRALEGLGCVVVQAADGAEALEALAASADGVLPMSDVVVLDVCMPGYSGLGILDVMRRFDEAPPTILVTGFDDESIDILAGRRGVMRVLHKPVDLDDLLAAVSEGIARSRASPRRGRSTG